MLLTQKLLGYLHRAFNRDPKTFWAISLDYAGSSMSWTVQDRVLTTAIVGGVGAPLTVDLTQYTLSSLTAFLAAQRGYTVSYIDPNLGGLGAEVLMDASNTPSNSNGNRLYGFTSLVWAYLESVSPELVTLQEQIELVPAEMSIPSADGEWLDYLGTYYNVPRNAAEVDSQYAVRIIAQTIGYQGNGISIGEGIQAFTGQPATVTDVILTTSVALYDGTYTYNGSINYNTTATIKYNLFDVAYSFDLFNGSDLTSFANQMKAIIEVLRDAGTHLRSLVLNKSVVSDTYLSPPSDIMAPIVAATVLTDTLTGPSDSYVLAVNSSLSDALTAPDDPTDNLIVVNGNRYYDGSYRFNGKILYDSGLTMPGTIEAFSSLFILDSSQLDGPDVLQ